MPPHVLDVQRAAGNGDGTEAGEPLAVVAERERRELALYATGSEEPGYGDRFQSYSRISSVKRD